MLTILAGNLRMKKATLADEILSLALLYEQEGVRLLRARADDSVERVAQARLNFAQAFDTLRTLPARAKNEKPADDAAISMEFAVLFRLTAASLLGNKGSKGRHEALQAKAMKPHSEGDAALRDVLLSTLPPRDREGIKVPSTPVSNDLFGYWRAAALTCADESITTDRGSVQLQTQHRRIAELLKQHAQREFLSHLADLVMLVGQEVLERRRMPASAHASGGEAPAHATRRS